MDRTDEELMRDFANGDPAGFDALLERYRRPVFAIIVSMLRERTFAEDIFQEVFMKVIRAAGAFDADRRFAPWLFRIVDNCCMDALRGAGRKRLGMEAAPAGVTAPQTANPETILLQKERRAMLAKAVARLPEPQRHVIELHEFASLTYAETAEIMDRPLNTVLSDMRRALKSLRKYLKDVE